jgi:C1A family cysteine protease
MAEPDGVIAMPKTGDYAAGGHAVLVVGYQDGEGDGGGRFIIRNSWGESWGIGGYGLLPYGYVDDYGQDAWVFADPSRQVAGGEP